MARRNIRRAQESNFDMSAAREGSIGTEIEFALTSVELMYDDTDDGYWFCIVDATDVYSSTINLHGEDFTDNLDDAFEAVDKAIHDCIFSISTTLDYDEFDMGAIEDLVSEAESWYDENKEYLKESKRAKKVFAARLGNRRRRARR